MEEVYGPSDPSILTNQERHVSANIEKNKDRGKLASCQTTSTMEEWQLKNEQVRLLELWGFGAFANPRIVMQNDLALISALVERWRSETNSFHFTFGEMSITLEDVYMLLGLPVQGRPLTFDYLKDPSEYWVNNWFDPLLTKKGKRKALTRGGISLPWLRKRYSICRSRHPVNLMVHTRAYVLYLCGAILFPTQCKNIVHVKYLRALQDPLQVGGFAWGAAVLGYLYRSMYNATQSSSKAIAGCTTLIQLWSYERLVPGRPRIISGTDMYWPRATVWAARDAHTERDNPHHHLRLYRGMFDNFDMNWVDWTPYNRFYDSDDFDVDEGLTAGLGRVPLIHWNFVEYQMPDRVLRQFNYVQHIPVAPVDMRSLRVEKNSKFDTDNYNVVYRQQCLEWDSFMENGIGIVYESENYCSIADYLAWFRAITKLRINPIRNTDPQIQQPRDYFDNVKALNVIEMAMSTLHRMSNHPMPHVFYDELQPFLGVY